MVYQGSPLVIGGHKIKFIIGKEWFRANGRVQMVSEGNRVYADELQS